MREIIPPLVAPLGDAFTILGFALAPFLLLPLATLVAPRTVAGVADPALSLIDAASRVVEQVARVALLAMVLAVAAAVLLRYVFGISYTGLDEGVLYLHATAFLLGAPLALRRDGHVRVDVFYAGLDKRSRGWVDVGATYVAAIPMMLALLLLGGPYVAQSWSVVERSADAGGLPLVWALKTLILVFAVTMLAQVVAWGTRAARRIRDVEDDGDGADARTAAEKIG